jgi:hypothetical protein
MNLKLTLTGRMPTRNSLKIVLINQCLDDLAITGMGLTKIRIAKDSHKSGQVVKGKVGSPRRENDAQNAKHNVARSRLGIYDYKEKQIEWMLSRKLTSKYCR